MAYDGCTSARDEPKKFPEIFRMFVALNRSQNISGMLLEINIIVTLQTGLSNQYPLNSEFLRDLTSKTVRQECSSFEGFKKVAFNSAVPAALLIRFGFCVTATATGRKMGPLELLLPSLTSSLRDRRVAI